MKRFFICCTVLFLLNGCYVKNEVSHLPEAENIHITNEGRVFISSGEGFFELTENNNEIQLRPFDTTLEACAFGGITQIHQTLYTVCSEVKLINAKKILFAIDLEQESPILNALVELNDLAVPNGLTSDGESALYLADTAYLGQGSITKITVDGQRIVNMDSQWATAEHNVYHPNGMKYLNGSIFFSDLGAIKTLEIDQAGNPQFAQQLHQRFTIYDDIFPFCGGVIATDYVNGQVVLISKSGKIQYKTGFGSFQGASSVAIGKPPHFSSSQLVITERGILFDKNSNIGNRVSTATFDFDLDSCP